MKILVLGGGGREHALIWKLKQSPMVDALHCAPGNAGIATLATCADLRLSDFDAVVKYVRRHAIDLTIVGPEQPLSEGIVDHFQKEGLNIFGPTKAAARLESSKGFAKEFMRKYRIPTAEFKIFTSSMYQEAHEHILRARYPLVLKADGLAAGKGVVIAESFAQANETLDAIFKQRSFGSAGDTIVMEEYMQGVEASVFALTDGKNFATLAPAQDHKRIFDGDQGKNTGGMGAYAPTRFVPPEILSQVKLRIIKPTLEGMANEGTPFSGCLYVGVMLTSEGPKVVEFNCRFGDPEAQVVLPLIEDDLALVMLSIAEGKMTSHRIKLHDACAVCVVMASNGYPDTYKTGKVIAGLDALPAEDQGVVVFHAGTKKDGNSIVSAGGRVLGVTAIGEANDLHQTIITAYNAVSSIRFDGAYYRTDIGKKGL